MAYKAFAALLFGAALSSSALAGTVTVNGNTTGGPTWNRPVEDGNNPPVPPPSLVGTNVRYQATSFTVSQAGAYDFLSVSNTTDYDNYLFLYQTAFDPTAPFTNVIIGDDDFTAVGVDSGFTGVALLTGVTYFAVSTGFANDDFGAYALTITGPGDITVGGAIPEPATWALMIGGFAAAGAAARVRRRNVTFA